MAPPLPIARFKLTVWVILTAATTSRPKPIGARFELVARQNQNHVPTFERKRYKHQLRHLAGERSTVAARRIAPRSPPRA